ncbi:tyrosine-type recombinase/integrase [Piscinibacter gummiphilus]|uniref:Tyrosine-type recombinase/integrase n=1 Tax=Piscinibacter gummiphilus TaxID=946333 RepID=A0ABZ0D136_9BURK|nr:tyrosine-type recombinase/integrase [Piscinibacter gummiphilus]WOB10959.1 tyrosine-type recombinase/integrase [Piscinibacter gummiphilus]
MSDLVTLDSLQVPCTLSGASGANRARGRSQIAAADDRSAVLSWLARFADSPATLANYRKESERLLLWCVVQHGRALSDLSHEDLLVYQRFLANPQPAERWVMAAGARQPRSSPLWRPFAGPLSPGSQRQALSILNGLFNWLVEAGYLAGNPLALSRRKAAPRAARMSRFLPHEHWHEVKTTISGMPTDSERDAARAARTRWLFSLLYIGGLRVSEACLTTMIGFFSRRSPDGRQRWWLEVTGKGGKTRLVPATDELMAELIRYRRSCGLSDLPTAGDDSPLLRSLIGEPKALARSAVHEIVKDVVRQTATRLRVRGPEHEAAAAHIERASTHWLRHTAGSHQSDSVDLKAVRDNLGHANLATTSIYVHSEDDARHDATNAGHRVNWEPEASMSPPAG